MSHLTLFHSGYRVIAFSAIFPGKYGADFQAWPHYTFSDEKLSKQIKVGKLGKCPVPCGGGKVKLLIFRKTPVRIAYSL